MTVAAFVLLTILAAPGLGQANPYKIGLDHYDRHPVIKRPKPHIVEEIGPNFSKFTATCTESGWIADTAPLDIYPEPSVAQLRRAFGRMECRLATPEEKDRKSNIDITDDHGSTWHTIWTGYDICYEIQLPSSLNPQKKNAPNPKAEGVR